MGQLCVQGARFQLKMHTQGEVQLNISYIAADSGLLSRQSQAGEEDELHLNKLEIYSYLMESLLNG